MAGEKLFFPLFNFSNTGNFGLPEIPEFSNSATRR
jgi:hypothetical protein